MLHSFSILRGRIISGSRHPNLSIRAILATIVLTICFYSGYSITVTNLTAAYKSGQVFLTWNKNTTGSALFLLYRSASPITSGSQLSSCQYLGYVNDSSAVDHNLSKADGVLRYLVIDSAGQPLTSTKGLFVATTEDNGNYYYAVTVKINNTEDQTIIVGSNSLQNPVTEFVHAQRAVFREKRIINSISVEIYSWFESMKIPHGPLVNNVGFLAFDIAVNRNNATSMKPLRYRFHPGGQTFLSNIDRAIGDEVLVNVEDYFPDDESAGWWGANENYNPYVKPTNANIPTSGINYDFSEERCLKTLNWALSKFPVDSNRVYVDGSSFGAVGAFLFPLHHPEKIAAAKVMVGIFDLGFLNDYNPTCTFNTGKKNRIEGDQRLGTVPTNLMTNEGYHTYDALNGCWWFHQYRNTDYPVFYTISGKQDQMMGWTEKVKFYDSINANHIGGYFFWDNRDHGSNTGRTWGDNLFDQYRYRKDLSYPAFANCSANENPGNGNGADGALFGSINGYLDWSNNSILDDPTQWQVMINTKNLKTYLNVTVPGPDSCTADVTPRRLQQFHPQPGSTLSWNLYHHNLIVQSGILPYTGGLIIIPQVKVYKDSCTLWLGYAANAVTLYRDADNDGYGNPQESIVGYPPVAGYVENNEDCNDTNAAINPVAAEVCNTVDDNCNGQTDEGLLLAFYKDEDGDGYGNKAIPTHACSAPQGFVSDSTDCNDGVSSIHPLAVETCNNLDDNCNTQIDEGLLLTFYGDYDADNYGNSNVSVLACEAPTGFVTDNTDCNDSSASVHPSAMENCNGIDDNCNTQIDEGLLLTFYQDYDEDNYGNSDVIVLACEAPTGFVTDNTDCNDSSASVHPSAMENCNGIDDNCNTQIDEGLLFTFYQDYDADNYGNSGVSVIACEAPTGFVTDNTDCNDSLAEINPIATEICNALDDNCDGQIDEGIPAENLFYADNDGDGFGNPADSIRACAQFPGFVTDNTDCNDIPYQGANIHPGMTEVCNGMDDNCDGSTDEGFVPSVYFYSDADGDGYGDASSFVVTCGFAPIGYVSDSTDCNDTNTSVNPGTAEICNSTDDNCNGETDEGLLITLYADADQDGYGNVDSFILGCPFTPGYVVNADDCDDTNNAISPAATEICNHVDDNCNGQTDEGVMMMLYADADADGFGDINSALASCSTVPGYVLNADDCNDSNSEISPIAKEICNKIDDNCNGETDEGLLITLYADADHDGYGNGDSSIIGCLFTPGYVANADDCDDTNNAISPDATETCNQIDDNCNGQTDEGLVNTYYADNDHDGFGNANASIVSCTPLEGYVTSNTDCNDQNGNINPGIPEICNSIDDNCNFQVDEGFIASVAASGIFSTTGTQSCPGVSTQLSVQGGVLGTNANWEWSTASCGGSVVGTEATITVSPTVTTTYYVRAIGSCNTTSCASITLTKVSVIPAKPGTITGSATGVCSQTLPYSIAPVAKAGSYSWTVPANATIVNGQGTTAIEVSFASNFSSGSICVSAVSACGSSAAKCLTVNGKPSNPGVITGPTTLCKGYEGAIYSIAPLTGATFYNWTVPSGALITSGQNTPSITVNYTIRSGRVTVTSGNACGNTTMRTLSVTLTDCRVSDDSLAANELTIYPNPATDKLSLEFESDINGRFVVVMSDASGRIILSNEYDAGDGQSLFSVDVASLASGLYWLTTKSESMMMIKKVLIQK